MILFTPDYLLGTTFTLAVSVNTANPKKWFIGKAEANVVVAVVGRVVVTVTRSAVLSVIVPAATANDTVLA